MKHRIVLWASGGFIIAACWFLYSVIRPIPITSAEPMVWTLARLTQPVVFASFYFHFGLRFYWVLLANAATFALAGLIVEILRRQISQAK
jgi:hypothetical protein